MIDKKESAPQIARLGQMRGYPRNEPAALNELIVAGCAAKTLEVCKRVIGGFLETATPETPCPMPADIRGAMYAADKPDYWQPEWGAPKEETFSCVQCCDTGMLGGSVAVTGDVWRWCSCKAAMEVLRDTPDSVDAMNRIRDSILRMHMPVMTDERKKELLPAAKVLA